MPGKPPIPLDVRWLWDAPRPPAYNMLRQLLKA
jgi:hypothetical protein